MLKKEDAISVERGYRNQKVYIFACRYTGCLNDIRVYDGKFQHVSGYCKHHARAYVNQPYISLYNTLRRRAKYNHQDFTLSYDEFVFLTQIGTCHYCAKEITWQAFGARPTKCNLDRKDNNKGYEFENVVVCCKECNLLRNKWLSYEEFKIVSLLLRRWRAGTLEDKQELEYMLSAWNMQIS